MSQSNEGNKTMLSQTDGGLVFDASDFMVNQEDFLSSAMAAHKANRKLQAWLSAQPVVFGHSDKGSKYIQADSAWGTEESEGRDTHTARLCAITPLQADSAEKFMQDWLNCAEVYAGQVIEGPFREFIERARKLTRGGEK